MIGQEQLLERIQHLIDINKFPKFCVLVGELGSGKKLIAHEIVNLLRKSEFYPTDTIEYILPDIKVDTIRQMIEDAYTTQDYTVMVIPDADTMSLNAKNALLKITEEPPKNVTFIMTLQDLSNTLETIKSRANVLNMDKYTLPQILEYAKVSNEVARFFATCDTPGEVNILKQYDMNELLEYVNLVIDNIAIVQPANAFKSSAKLALKSDEGIDLKIFWKVFTSQCHEHMIMESYTVEQRTRYARGGLCTCKYLSLLNKVGVNRQQLYDSWVFDIRKVWAE